MQSCTRGDVINKENADSMWTCLLRGGNGCLFMDFRDPISSPCQQKDPCRVLLKFELLINLSTSIQISSFLSTVTTQTLVSYVMTICYPMVLEFKMPHFGLAIVRLHRVQPSM
jgi:hypothetical protein